MACTGVITVTLNECVAVSRVRVMGFESDFVHHTVFELQNPLQPRRLVCHQYYTC